MKRRGGQAMMCGPEKMGCRRVFSIPRGVSCQLIGSRIVFVVAARSILAHYPAPEIMEERYEIRGKIGQGGLGAVYRGYDTRMNREVAIKRISVTSDDPELQEESTRQLIKEAGALASLQHPHIVTIYDVGADEDGPYVVMELISGKTLDELIERAPLTWNDFRELALQTQEALIAAQELDLIHSDIKPSNLMLTWLPSGKFQMKIVDFGLATLTQSQSLEELQELEAVFGSIFFMAPEQFERVPIDVRTDMYAMGCVYYQALTGTYPFKGETGNEVMDSHLLHQVIPIQEVRSDIPLWACDWIMWHINRQASDRPESAREALQVFLQNDKNPNPTLSLGKVAPKLGAPGHRMVTPAAGTQNPSPTRRMIPPGPKAHPQAHAIAPVAVAQKVAEPEPMLDTTRLTSVPQPLLPPEGSKPSVHTNPHGAADGMSSTATVQMRPATPSRQFAQQPKKAESNIGKKIVIALAALVILGVVGGILYKQIQQSKASKRYGNLLVLAQQESTTELPISMAEFERMLDDAANANTDEKQKTMLKALALAKPNDGSNFDKELADFPKNMQMLPEVREAFLREVIPKRISAAMVRSLMEFARSTPDIPSAIAAFQALKTVVGDDEFEALLSVAVYNPNAKLRQVAEDCAVAILKRSANRGRLLPQVDAALASTKDPKIRQSLQRMKVAGGGK